MSQPEGQGGSFVVETDAFGDDWIGFDTRQEAENHIREEYAKVKAEFPDAILDLEELLDCIVWHPPYKAPIVPSGTA